MTSRPWMKFYPADWQADELLGMCTLAARGLWLEMIGIMHKAVPYGHLLVNGRNPTDVQLAALARCPPDQVPGLLDELENAGVFSRARNRTIYSRRMTRDEKRRKDGQIGKETGEKLPNSRRSQAIEKSGGNVTTLKVAGKVVDQPPSYPYARGQSLEEESFPNGKRQSAKQIALAMVEIWRLEAVPAGLPIIRKLTDNRIVSARKRFAEDFDSDIERWRDYVRHIANCPFLIGDNERQFKVDFGWVLKPDNMAKIMEGKYDAKSNGRGEDRDLSFYDGPTEPPPTLEELRISMERPH